MIDTKILHLPFTFYPDPCGGTEVYVDALAKRMNDRGLDAMIAAPGQKNEEYDHFGLRVHRFATTNGRLSLEDLYGDGDPEAGKSFEVVLDRIRPELVHFHAMSPAISIRLVRSIRQRKVPLIYTFHTPTASCQRGTLLKWGKTVCDGIMDRAICAPCVLHGRGVPRTLAVGIDRASKFIGPALEKSRRQGGLWTALRTPQLVARRIETSLEFFHSVDHIVAVCDWVRALLLRNGIPDEKITLSRQGLCQDPTTEHAIDAEMEGECFSADVRPERLPLRLVFLGRLDPTKGAHILIRALKKIPEANVRLAIYGISQGESGRRYEMQLRAEAANDARIEFFPPVPASRVIATLREWDLLVVPSQWLETGPMVILEAFAAGIPVLGSRLGGIAELVQIGVNGLLLQPTNIAEWASAIQQLSSNAKQLDLLRKGIKPPKRMDMVAAEMIEVYQSMLSKKARW